MPFKGGDQGEGCAPLGQMPSGRDWDKLKTHLNTANATKI